MSEAPAGVEAQYGDKKIKLWGENFVQIAQMIALVYIVFLLVRHDSDAATANQTSTLMGKAQEQTQAIKEQTQVMREQLNATREQNCLTRLTSEQKKNAKEIEFCQALGKGR